MVREECERKIAEYMTAIRMTYLEYNPDGEYLAISLQKSTNGNDNGDWDCHVGFCNNAYFGEDKDKPISFDIHKDIKDEKYWKCVSEQDDRETEELAGYEGKLLPDGTFFYSKKVVSE